MGLVIADQAGGAALNAIISISPKRHGITALAKDQPGERVSHLGFGLCAVVAALLFLGSVEKFLADDGGMLAVVDQKLPDLCFRAGLDDLAIVHDGDSFPPVPFHFPDVVNVFQQIL